MPRFKESPALQISLLDSAKHSDYQKKARACGRDMNGDDRIDCQQLYSQRTGTWTQT